ncbi:hypothetical protein AO498_14222 [Algoriphagus sanaruensis]|uniref:Uncharacterized protein n=1 Tax=Algoriphagus sanaruensis TaxID=1727163 RepID=A0A142ER48_9BACT|nr:hypothetical protein AO498_14222 [Algoriphagus sanaruensis]
MFEIILKIYRLFDFLEIKDFDFLLFDISSIKKSSWSDELLDRYLNFLTNSVN